MPQVVELGATLLRRTRTRTGSPARSESWTSARSAMAAINASPAQSAASSSWAELHSGVAYSGWSPQSR